MGSVHVFVKHTAKYKRVSKNVETNAYMLSY